MPGDSDWSWSTKNACVLTEKLEPATKEIGAASQDALANDALRARELLSGSSADHTITPPWRQVQPLAPAPLLHSQFDAHSTPALLGSENVPVHRLILPGFGSHKASVEHFHKMRQENALYGTSERKREREEKRRQTICKKYVFLDKDRQS
jgi:hypothetical protein